MGLLVVFLVVAVLGGIAWALVNKDTLLNEDSALMKSARTALPGLFFDI
jgi:hypothetical protein